MKYWVIKSLVIAILAASILFGHTAYKNYLEPSFVYYHNDNGVSRINKDTGEVYKFKAYSGTWELLNK